MTKVENPDNCLVCGKPLPEDYISVKVPGSVSLHPTVRSGPGVFELRFCCERHKRDYGEKRYGRWFTETDDE